MSGQFLSGGFMKKVTTERVMIDGLEPRLLLHGGIGGDGGGHGHHHGHGGGGCGGGGEGGVGLFVPATPNAAVQADLDTLKTDRDALHADLKALSTADKTTLK